MNNQRVNKAYDKNLTDMPQFLKIMQSQGQEAVTLFQENGQKYIGKLQGGKKHDEDAMLFDDHHLYRGAFVNDVMEGQASVTSVDGSNHYSFEGHFKNGKKNGQGDLIISGQEKYSGIFKDDRYHGSGVHVNKKGEVYEGDFVDGRREGIGNLKTGSFTYIGEFKNDKFHGRGQITHDGPNLEQNGKFIYSGQFSQGIRQGHGEMYFSQISLSNLPSG